MGSTLTNLLCHVVFSVQGRRNLLTADRRKTLYAYVGGIIRGEGGQLLVIGGTRDHVHILMRLPASVSLSHMMQRVKGGSSRRMNEECSFRWQEGYGAFSVSKSAVEQVKSYIESQQERHSRMDFANELRRLLDRHGIEYNERYLWD
ncbi:MAG: IS200/IS605 family transposase [Candidatus Brocadiia bacterium]